nr:MAG: ORF1 [Torque teno midi virus]
MPFYWWQRRRRFWRGQRRPYYKRRWTNKRRKRRYIRRHKHRRPTRRRRRRRQKVRRKFKKIHIQQWQPKYITKCTIKGLQLFVLGANGKQMNCFTDERYNWTPAKAPGGGGFAAEQYSLQYLYHEYVDGNNYWTRSNATKDLVRFTGSSFTFYRHPKTSFLIHYDRHPKKDTDKYYYCSIHPKELLLRKRTKILHSKKERPNAKQRMKLKIKPPNNLQTNWYFQTELANRPLLNLQIAAADLGYSYLSSVDTNQLISLYTINTQFYPHPNWGDSSQNPYKPYSTIKLTLTPQINGKDQPQIDFHNQTYKDSIDYSKGWFQSRLLKAVKLKEMEVLPISACRYNPTIDNGHGNAIWVKHITQQSYTKPNTDKSVLLQDKPLWQLLYGYLNWIQKIKPDEEVLTTYVLCITSPAIYPFKTSDQCHVLIDSTFINGLGPYEEFLTDKMKQLWFPTLQHQQQSINNIVLCGPYIPKYTRDRESTWDLHGKYSFYFKWGGDDIQNQDAYDPSKQATFQTPGNLTETIQISDPSQQIPTTLLHAWDLRRGLITPTALKRIRENLPIDETLSTDSDHSQPKKKKVNNNMPYQEQETQEIQNCLQALFEKDTYQEPQTQEQLLQLIQQQHQQQNLIKFNLLHLIADLKKQQQSIKLHTGLLN